MLYTLLCILAIIAIFKLLNLEWVFSVVGVILLLGALVIVWYVYPNEVYSVIGFIVAIGIIAIPAVALLVKNDKEKLKNKQRRDKELHEKEIDELREKTKGKKGIEVDELYEDAVKVVRKANNASLIFIEKELQVDLARAFRLRDLLELHGVIGGYPHRSVISHNTKII